MPAKDITGQRFGRLIALNPTNLRVGRSIMWECRCDCGGMMIALICTLHDGRIKSCGCLWAENGRKKGKESAKDITGQRVGRLVVLNPTNLRMNSSIMWECQCDCGQMTIVGAGSLYNEDIKSCGCFQIDSRHELAKDITGQRFGRLTTLNPTNLRVGSSVMWECRCDCGKMTISSMRNLVTLRTRSCGCLREASRFTKNTNIDPMDVPFEVTDCIRAKRELKKAINGVIQ